MVAVVIAAGTGGPVPLRRAEPAEPLARHRHPTGAERGPGPAREMILRAAPGLVDAARADGANPRAVGVARLLIRTRAGVGATPPGRVAP